MLIFLRLTEAFLGSQQPRDKVPDGHQSHLSNLLKGVSKMKLDLLSKSERDSQEFQGGRGF